jgi:multidrug efflux pump subunit AcrA (membrane-fusion protein)
MKSKVLVTGGTALLVLVSAGGVVLFGGEEKKGEPAAQKRRTLTVSGVMEPFEQTKVFARLAGTVRRVRVDLGDRVQKGQVLAELDVPEVGASLKLKQALVAQAEAEVEKEGQAAKAAVALLDLDKAQVREAEAALKHARADAQFRKADYDRMQRLVRDKAVSVNTYRERRQKWEASQAAVAQAAAKLEAVKAALKKGKAMGQLARATIQVAKARLEVARADLGRVSALLQAAQVRAPFDGIVTRRLACLGDVTGTAPGRRGQPLFSVARVDSLRVTFAVPEAAATRLHKGTPAVIDVRVLGKKLTGKVTRTAGIIDPKTQTLRAEIDLPNPKGQLLPGMSVTVTVTLEAPLKSER